MKLDPYLTPHTKINSKWIKDLKVRPEPVKFLDENIGKKLHGIVLCSDFLDMTPKAQAKKPNKQEGLKLGSFCTAKETTNKMKRKPIEYEKTFANYLSDEGLISKACKELICLNSKIKKNKQPNPKMVRRPK